MKNKKYTSKTIREVLEKVDGIAFANGKVNGIGWGDYRLEDGLREIKILIKKMCHDCPYIEENIKEWFKKEK
jgi:hypothetical protein